MQRFEGVLAPGESPMDQLEATQESMVQLLSLVDSIRRLHGSPSLGFDGLIDVAMVLESEADGDIALGFDFYDPQLGIPKEAAQTGLALRARLSDYYDWSDPDDPKSNSLRVELFRQNDGFVTHKEVEVYGSRSSGVATEADVQRLIDVATRARTEQSTGTMRFRPEFLEEIRRLASESTAYQYEV